MLEQTSSTIQRRYYVLTNSKERGSIERRNKNACEACATVPVAEPLKWMFWDGLMFLIRFLLRHARNKTQVLSVPRPQGAIVARI